MDLIHSKRIGALLAVVVAAAGCGKSSSSNNDGGSGGVTGPEGLHVAVILPDGLQDGGPAGFGAQVSNITVQATLDGALVTPDQVKWAITDASGQADPPGAVTPSPSTGATTSFTIPDFETVRTAANAWLGRAYGTDAIEYVRAPEREQLLSFGPQQVQAMSFQVIATVTKGSRTASASALVSPVTVSSGGNVLPQGMMVVANAPTGGTYAWSLKYLPASAAKGAAFGDLPAGVALKGETTKNPYVVPTVAGVYQLQNGAGAPILFRVSTFHGVGRADTDKGSDGVACASCHGKTDHGDYTLAQFAEWQGSAHFKSPAATSAVSLFQLGIDGGLGARYGESCISCHTVGYSKVPSADNNGFDDVAAAAGWSFPVPAAGNFAAMPAGLQHRAGVQCESCHGPLEPADHSSVAAVGYGSAVSPKASMSPGLCMTCHDGMQDGNQGPQWATTGHADVQLTLDDASYESRGTNAVHCGRCHSGEGFVTYLAQEQAGTPGNLITPTTCTKDTPGCTCTTTNGTETCAPSACTPGAGYTGAGDPLDPACPCKLASGSTTCSPYFYAAVSKIGLLKANIHSVTCQTCHDPHTTALRLETGDTKVTAASFQVTNAGKGALCIVCHNSRGAAIRQGDFVLSNFTAPHTASQGDVYAGRNAFFLPELVKDQAAATLPLVSPHANASDSCVLCHVRSVPDDVRDQYKVTGTNHTFRASMEVCANCHSATEVAEFKDAQETNETKLTQLLGLITSQVKDRLNAAGFDAPVRYDYTTDLGITAPTDPTIAAGQVSVVELYESHGSPAVKLTLGDGTKFATTLANLYVADTAVVTNGKVTGTTLYTVATVAADQDFARAVYNYLLIHGGAAGGVHNFPFTQKVLDASIAKLSP